MEEDMFAGVKRKSKKTKQQPAEDIVLPGTEELKAESTVEDAVRPNEASANLTMPDESLLDDFADLKKKKKTKKVALDLEEVATPGAPTEPAADDVPADDDFSDLKLKKKKKKTVAIDDVPTDAATGEPTDGPAGDDFADLVVKKKSKKKAFDMEEFEKELAATEGGAATGSGANSDDDGAHLDDEEPEGENPFAAEGGAADESKTAAELAAEQKAWLKEPGRDYQYTELLGRFYSLLHESHPSLGTGARKRHTLPPPSIHRDGTKRTIFANVSDMCKRLRRQPEHLVQFLFAELGTTGSVDGSGRLVIKGRFQQKQIENVLRRYLSEYVTCKTCKSPDTALAKENRLYFVRDRPVFSC